MTTDPGIVARVRASVGAHPGEGQTLVWATAYYFLVLCAYYVIRPIRDDMGAASGAENLAWLFTGTMVGMLLVHPLYTSLVSKLRRRQFIAWTYRFFILNLVAFYAVFRAVDASQAVWVGRVFFIWTSVFNLFVEELQRHLRLPAGRSGGRVVVHRHGRVRVGAVGPGVHHGAAVTRMVGADGMAW